MNNKKQTKQPQKQGIWKSDKMFQCFTENILQIKNNLYLELVLTIQY